VERDTRATDRLQIEDRRRPGWHWAYHETIDNYGARLGPYGLAIYYALCRHANDDRECWPSLQTMADETGMSRRQAIREVDRLVEIGLIKKESRTNDQHGDPDSNLYIIVDPARQRGGSDRESPPSDLQSPGVVNTSHQGSDRESPKGEPLKDNQSKDNGGMKDTYEFLRKFGLDDPLLTEIANSHDLDWCRAAASEMDQPGGIVHLHRQGWESSVQRRRSRSARASPEDRYRYIQGEYADYVEH